MWAVKILLLASLCNFLDSYSSPKNFGYKIYKHVIVVTDMGVEDPIPYPRPLDDGEMIALGKI